MKRRGSASPFVACVALALAWVLPAARVAGQASGPDLADDLVAAVVGTVGPDAQAVPTSHAPSALVVTDPPFKLKWKKHKLGKGTYSSIAVDPAGNPHVVFDLELPDLNVLTHAWAEGLHWFSEPVDPDHWAAVSAMAIENDGDIHVAYAGDDQLRYARHAGGVWQSEAIELGGYGNSIAVDEEGFAHIVHIVQSAFDPVRYARQTASGWEVETVATGGYWYAGSTLLLRDGKVYVVYADHPILAFPKIYLAIRDNGVWSTEEIDEGSEPRAAFTTDGTLHVAYDVFSQTELRHAWKTESGWSHEALIAGLEIFGQTLPPNFGTIGQYNCAVAADAFGRLQLANGVNLSKGPASTSALFESSFDGASWSPSLLSAKQTGFNNSIAVDGTGLVHISTSKAAGAESTAIDAWRLQGRKLAVGVVPKETGSVSIAPTGTVCTSKATETVYPGTELTLTAAAATGFSFAGWSGAASGTDPEIVLTVGKKLKVIAHFEPAP